MKIWLQLTCNPVILRSLYVTICRTINKYYRCHGEFKPLNNESSCSREPQIIIMLSVNSQQSKQDCPEICCKHGWS